MDSEDLVSPIAVSVAVQKPLVPSEGLGLSAAALWMLPRLVQRSLLNPAECLTLKRLALRGEQHVLAPFEVYLSVCRDESFCEAAAEESVRRGASVCVATWRTRCVAR
jgi:hypothetical protein